MCVEGALAYTLSRPFLNPPRSILSRQVSILFRRVIWICYTLNFISKIVGVASASTSSTRSLTATIFEDRWLVIAWALLGQILDAGSPLLLTLEWEATGWGIQSAKFNFLDTIIVVAIHIVFLKTTVRYFWKQTSVLRIYPPRLVQSILAKFICTLRTAFSEASSIAAIMFIQSLNRAFQGEFIERGVVTIFTISFISCRPLAFLVAANCGEAHIYVRIVNSDCVLFTGASSRFGDIIDQICLQTSSCRFALLQTVIPITKYLCAGYRLIVDILTICAIGWPR